MSTRVPHYHDYWRWNYGAKRCFLFEKAVGSGRDVPFRISVVEKSPAFGGKIHTLERDGFVIEKGPGFLLARKRPIIDLAYDLGLENELTGTNPKAKKTYIVRRAQTASHAAWLSSWNSDANDTIYEDRPYFPVG